MTKDEFLVLAASRYDDLQHLHTEQTNFYDYEKGFAELWTELGRAVLEGNLGERPESPRKKSGSSSVFVELGETDQHPLLKTDKVAKTVTHSFHRFNGVVNPFDKAGRESMREVV